MQIFDSKPRALRLRLPDRLPAQWEDRVTIRSMDEASRCNRCTDARSARKATVLLNVATRRNPNIADVAMANKTSRIVGAARSRPRIQGAGTRVAGEA